MNNPNRLILVRHGRAEFGAPDKTRRLTPLGQQEIRNLAYRIKATDWPVTRIVHSGYERTKETANILSAVLHPEDGQEVMKGITPASDVFSKRHELEDANHLLIVSHLPFLDDLTYAFITPKNEATLFCFTPGAAVGLKKELRWALAWHMQPSCGNVPSGFMEPVIRNNQSEEEENERKID